MRLEEFEEFENGNRKNHQRTKVYSEIPRSGHSKFSD
jgi:hypothetical protein